MKKLSKLFLIFALMLCFNTNILVYGNTISVFINDEKIKFETEPEIINNTTMVPLRTTFETLGYEISWDETTQTITGLKGVNIINLTIGSTEAYINGIKTTVLTAPVIKDGFTLVPLRFIAESSGAGVTWIEESQKVEIITYDYLAAGQSISQTNDFDIETLNDAVVTIYSDSLQGSGVVLTEDGYIVTNFHVIENTSSIVVLFKNGIQYTGSVYVVGYDSVRDIAVFKINASNLPYAKLPKEYMVKSGESVVAIGSPGGVPNVASYGSIEETSKYILSSSAEIHLGSSGGGLFNSNGELIGITSATTEIGISFSIPIYLIAEMDLNQNLSMSEWKKVKAEIVPPEYIEFKKEGNAANLYWSNVYGADSYKVYVSYDKTTGYKSLTDKQNKNLWSWGFPRSLSIENMNYEDVYVKISSVKDGVESELSPPSKLILK